MTGVAQIYTVELYDNFRPLYANWQPDRPVKLGDFGPVDANRQFQQMGNVVNDRGLTFTERAIQGKPFQVSFASQGVSQIKLNAKGETSPGNPVASRASLEVAFSSEDALFFNAAECASSAIEDKAALGKQIMDLYAAGRWDLEWAIITDLIDAGATTIAISGGQSASITFGATGDVAQIDLASASVGLAITTATNVGFQMASSKGLKPLFGLCKIQSSFWSPDKFGPLCMGGSAILRETLAPLQPLSAARGADVAFLQLQ